jgi:8-oxo-dGTP diphosphatase
VDVAVALLTLRQGRLAALASSNVELGGWQLPCGAWSGSDLDLLAASILAESTGASPFFLEQLRTYASGSSLTVAYVAVVPEETMLSGSSRAFALDDITPAGVLPPLHERIVDDAVERVRAKFEYTTVATSLVSEPFTIPELRRVYEAVWGVTLHPANFRRKVLATPGFVADPELPAHAEAGDDRRGPDLYLRGTAALLHPAMLRPQ